MTLHRFSILKRFLPYLGAALIIWLLLRQISLHLIGQLIGNAQFEWIVVGFGWYAMTIILRAYRFGAMLNMKGWYRPLSLLPDMLALSLINNLFPARAGELSFPIIMHRRHHISVSDSLAILVLARFFDFLCVICLFIVFALLNMDTLTISAGDFIMVLSLLLIPLVIMGALLPWLGSTSLQGFMWFMQRLDQAERPFVQKLLSGGQKAVAAIDRIHTLKIYSLVFGWSLAGWLTTFAWFAAFMQAINVPVPYPSVIVGATFATLTKALPFITVGGFGAHEAGWAFGFHLIGMTADLAIASGFAVNILTLLASIIVSFVAFCFNPHLFSSLVGSSKS
jgi:uncharacterized membrane protein YbhN (UPF0104 family)